MYFKENQGVAIGVPIRGGGYPQGLGVAKGWQNVVSLLGIG